MMRPTEFSPWLCPSGHVSEPCQVTVKDIDARGFVSMLSITDEGQSQQVKSSVGVRTAPIHSKPIRLGFLSTSHPAARWVPWPSLENG
jgi:hypothetical protein